MKLSTALIEFLAAKRDSDREHGIRRRCAPLTLKFYQKHLEGFITWTLVTTGQEMSSKLTVELVNGFLTHREQLKRKNETLRLDSVSLCEFVKWGTLKRYWKLEHEHIRRYTQERGLPKPYKPHERDALMNLALDGQDAVLRALLYYGGLRAAEALGLRLKDITPPYELPTGAIQKGSMRVLGKGLKERDIPIAAPLWAALEPHIATMEGMHPDTTVLHLPNGREWKYDAVKYRLKKWGAEAGVTRPTAHRMRHSLATDMLGRTGNLRLVQKILGHASPATTAIYTDVVNDEMAAAMDLLPSYEREDAPSHP